MLLREDVTFVDDIIDASDGKRPPTEHVYTELFAGLLRDPGLRHVFFHDVARLDVPAGILEAAEVTTGVKQAGRSYPDIFVDSGDDLRILVENKLDAAFTARQPHEYVEHLLEWRVTRPGGFAAVVLQVPEHRLVECHTEGWNRIECSPTIRARFPAACRDGSAFSSVHCAVVSWAQTRRALIHAEIADPVTAYFVRYFLHASRLQARPVGEVAEDRLDALRSALADCGCAPILREADCIGFEVDGGEPGGRAFWVGFAGDLLDAQGEATLVIHLHGSRYTSGASLRASGRKVIDALTVDAIGWIRGPVVLIELMARLDPAEAARHLASEIGEIRRLACSGSP